MLAWIVDLGKRKRYPAQFSTTLARLQWSLWLHMKENSSEGEADSMSNQVSIIQQKWCLPGVKGQRKIGATLRGCSYRWTRRSGLHDSSEKPPTHSLMRQHKGRGHQQWWNRTTSEKTRDASTPRWVIMREDSCLLFPLLSPPFLPPFPPPP